MLAAQPVKSVPFLKKRLLPPSRPQEPETVAGAIQTLELADTPDAGKMLETLAARGAGPAVKQRATAALSRLKAREVKVQPLEPGDRAP